MRSFLALGAVAGCASLSVGGPSALLTASQAKLRGGTIRAIGSLFDLMAGGEPQMVAPENALPGRSQKMMIPDRHYVLGNKMDVVPEGHMVDPHSTPPTRPMAPEG